MDLDTVAYPLACLHLIKKKIAHSDVPPFNLYSTRGFSSALLHFLTYLNYVDNVILRTLKVIKDFFKQQDGDDA